MKDRINLDDPNYDHSQRVVVQNNKAKVVWLILGVIASILIIIAFTSQSSKSGNNALDPNRTREACSKYGEARVFGSQHDSTICYPDYDGYYHVTLGHHHHK